MLSTSKRQPYASKACSECQRRKTKCNEERPCPSCRTRDVECRSWDGTTDAPSAAKRRKKSRTAARNGRAGDESPAAFESLKGANEALKEEVLRLRRDVDLLSHVDEVGHAQIDEVPKYHPPVPLLNHVEQLSEYLYPLEDPSLSRPEPDVPTPDSAQTDTFNASNLWASPNAMANKVSAIRATILCEPPFMTEAYYPRNDTTFTLTLPSADHLRRQIDFFLSDFDDFFPYFRQASLQKRLSTALRSLSYSERRTTVHVPWQHSTIFAILCNILSVAEIIMGNNTSLDVHTGEHWFLQGKKLMEQFEDMVGDSVEVVVYNLLVAGCMMEAERLRTAASYIVRAVQGALSIGLNDKTRWRQEADDIVDRRCLWWTLYFSEKRIHYRCGIPYLLRPEDVNMDHVLPQSDHLVDGGKLRLTQGMISYAQLWTSIWSGFLAPNATHAGNWLEVQIADAQVVIRYLDLPQQLHWDTEKIEQYIESGVTESSIRQRLQVFLWHQSLRLIIRQSRVTSPRGDAERQKSCFSVCKDIVAAISQYTKHFQCQRPIGYFLTCSLVDCLFYLKNDQVGSSNLVSPTEIQDIFREVHGLLETLALSVGSARRALAALRCALIQSSTWDCVFNLDEMEDNADTMPETDTAVKENPTEVDRVFPDAFSDANMTDTLKFFGLMPQ